MRGLGSGQIATLVVILAVWLIECFAYNSLLKFLAIAVWEAIFYAGLQAKCPV